MSARKEALRISALTAVDTRPLGSQGVTHLDKHQAHAVQQAVGCYDSVALWRNIDSLCCHDDIEARELGRVDGWPINSLRWRGRLAKSTSALRVIVTGGVHGVEPAGPAAALCALWAVISDPEQHADLDLTVVPLVNPVGYQLRTRGNGACVDLNRHFSDKRSAPDEVAIVRRVLRTGPYHLGIDLHSSRSVGERGFFALHRNAGDLLRPAMQRFGTRHPILRESTDYYLLEAEGVLRSGNDGTLKDYLSQHGTRWAMTVEAPAVWPYERQVRGSVEAVHTLVETARDLTAELDESDSACG